MQNDEIRELTDVEIRARVADLHEEQFRLRFRSATETLEQPLRLRVIRKEIARMKTILRERELGMGSAAPPTRAASGRRTARGAR